MSGGPLGLLAFARVMATASVLPVADSRGGFRPAKSGKEEANLQRRRFLPLVRLTHNSLNLNW